MILIDSFHASKVWPLLLALLITGCFDNNEQVEQQKTDKSYELEKYAFSNANVKSNYAMPSISGPSDCSMVLQFVATRAEGIEFIQDHIDSFKSDHRLNALPICINQPVWFETSHMSCSNNPNERLKCDIASLITLADKRAFTHAVVVGKSGKANVHNGIMYLDYNDSYSVFVHELAHFAGFVDEYPLATELANNICKAQTHPNILVYNANTKHSDNLIAVRTCDNHANQAFKLVQEMTFMEYHDVGLIPDEYLDIWIQRLRMVAKLTPAYVNFAQYYEEQGDAINADKWWQDYQEYL